MQVSWQSSYLTFDRTQNVGCLRPRIVVELALRSTVYVAREFAPGSCAHEAIREHEMRHVRANEHAFEAAAAHLEQQMLAHFDGRIFYGDVQAMLAELEASVESVWLPAVRGKFNEVERVHAAIDSPQEYAGNRTICQGEVVHVLRGGRTPE
jgi:hypothetical protein